MRRKLFTLAAALLAISSAQQVLWSQTTVWNQCDGSGAPSEVYYSGDAWDLGGGAVLLQGFDPTQHTILGPARVFDRRDAATGKLTYSIDDPIKTLCTQSKEQCMSGQSTVFSASELPGCCCRAGVSWDKRSWHS